MESHSDVLSIPRPKTAAELSLAAHKLACATARAEDARHLTLIREAEAKKQGRDELTRAYLRTLPEREQRRLVKLAPKKFARAMREMSRRAHALHASGTFTPDLPPAA